MKVFMPRRLIISLGTTALFLLCSSFLTIPFAGIHPIEEIFEAKNTSVTEIAYAQRIEEFLKKEVPGLSQSYHDVLDMIVNEGHNVWIIGGAVRDLLTKEGEASPRDLDFTFDCPLEEIEQILIVNSIPYTRIPGYDVISIGSSTGCEMEGIESSFSIEAKDEELEFTVNTIHYHLNTATFEQRFKNGLKDLDEKRLVVISKNLDEWLYAGQSGRPIKIFRYWKMRGKGFQGPMHLERFMVLEAAKAFRNDPEAFKSHLLQYLGSHYSSFDHVSEGCALTMGARWCKENVSALQIKARALNDKIDAIWKREKLKAMQAQAEKMQMRKV